MDLFEYKDGELYCEGVRAAEIADKVGTPAYVYSKGTAVHHYKQIQEAFAEVDPMICYSVKANSNRALIRALGEAGAAFDIVSGGELYRILAAGQSAERVVFAGVGKSREEMEYALKEGIFSFNAESEPELDALSEVAGSLGKIARVSLRVNPDVDALTHAHTTTGKAENKFGIAMERAPKVAKRVAADDNLQFLGFHMHIGSQLTEVEPYREAVEKALALVGRCTADGLEIEYLNVGGGFGIFYTGGEAVRAQDFADAVLPVLKKSGLKIIMEPGRFIVGNAGVLLSRVIFVKKTDAKTFVICDAAMNDLIRPVLYGAYHRIRPVKPRTSEEITVDVVGPVCESGDFLAKDREMPPVAQGDLIAIFSAGAYSFVMSSNFNSRGRACEVVADGDSFRVVRERETYEDLIRLEK